MIFSSLLDRLASSVRTLLIALAFAAAAIAPAQAHPVTPDADIEARNATIVREAFDRWNAGGNVFAGLLARDVVWTIRGSGPVADTYRGVEDFIKRGASPLTRRLTTPLRPVVHGIWTEDDTVVIRFDASATTTSGAPYRNQFVWIFRMEGGSVVEAEAFLDLVAYQRVIDSNEPREQ